MLQRHLRFVFLYTLPRPILMTLPACRKLGECLVRFVRSQHLLPAGVYGERLSGLQARDAYSRHQSLDMELSRYIVGVGSGTSSGGPR